MVLGKTESVGVKLTVDEPPGSEDRPLRVAVNVGSFTELTRTGPGTFQTVYIPPTTRFPQVALVAIWRETGPDAPIDVLRIPLCGLSNVPVSAPKGAAVTVEVAKIFYGPFTADAAGQALAVIVVPPDVKSAGVVVKVPGGAITSKKLPIEVPDYNRLTAAVVPHAVVADGKSPVRLEVVYDLGGADVTADRIQVTTPNGSALFQRAGSGHYSYLYTPPAGLAVAEVPFTIKIAGDPHASASARVSIGLPPPARIVVRPPDRPLRANGKSSAKISLLIFDSAGLGLPGETPEVTANGAALPAPEYLGNGLYQTTYTAPSDYPAGGLVQLVARAGQLGSSVVGAVNYQLDAAPTPRTVTSRSSPSPVPLGGQPAQLVLDVRDAAGNALRGAKLLLVAREGTAGRISERPDGQYQADYTAPSAAPPGDAQIRVIDESGAFDQAVAVALRENPGRLLVGVRAGFVHSLGSLYGARLGGDATLRLGGSGLSLGLAATFGSAVQTVSDASGAFTSRTTVTVIPVALRLGYEVWAARRASLTFGVEAIGAFARMKTTLTGVQQSRLGGGGAGFLSFGYALGPGQLFAEGALGTAPVEGADFRLDAAGVAFEGGYRVVIF